MSEHLFSKVNYVKHKTDDRAHLGFRKVAHTSLVDFLINLKDLFFQLYLTMIVKTYKNNN